jgi:carbon monoxide dehydrogenase subunit G
MAHYRTTVETPATADEVFAYLADFATVAQWDPGVSDAELIDGEPGRTGARYRVDARFLWRTLPLEYEILEAVEPAETFPGRVVLEAQTSDFRSYDVITVTPRKEGCSVTYDADLALLGVRRPFDPLLAMAFRVIGDRARAGLAAAVQMRPVA